MSAPAPFLGRDGVLVETLVRGGCTVLIERPYRGCREVDAGVLARAKDLQ